MAILRNDTTVRSADGQSTSPIITAANIGNYGISTTSTYYIGTTQNVFNRASGAQTLTGVSIDGNAATVTNGLTTTNYSSYALPISGGTMTGVLQSNKPINASGATYGSQATYVGNWSGTGWWGLGSESGHILKFDQVAYADVNSPTWIGATDLVLKLGTKFVRDSYYRTISGFSDYYGSGTSGWYTVASITLTTNCTGGVLYGTLYDQRYDGADAYQISIVARAECDFTTNNESHYVNVGCAISGSTAITNYQSKIRVLLVASSANSRTYEVQFLETAWNRDTWQLETSGSPVWTIYSTAQAPGTSTGTARVFYISNQNADNIRANTASYSPVYYDSNDTSYYLDAAGTSRLNTTRIGNINVGSGTYLNTITPIGDTNINLSSPSGAFYFDTFPRMPGFYDSANTAYYIDPASTSIVNSFKVYDALYFGDYTTYLSQATPYLRITTANGYGNFGPANSSWFHMTTDRPNFYMAVGLHINGDLFIYNTQSQLTSTSVRAPIFYDSGDTTYYLDPANTGTSLLVAGKVGIGITSPLLKLQVDAAPGNPATTGTTQNGIFRISNSTDNAVLDFGMRAAGAGAWLQSTDETSLAANYPLLLNPNGANVGINNLSADTNLQIVGHVHVGNQTTFENAGGWNKTIYLDGAIHARMRIIGSAYASGKNSQTETNIWVDNSVAPYSGLSTNAGSFTISAGYTTLTNSARSPIFYDSDNTSYYLDAASTSSFNALNLASTLAINGGDGIRVFKSPASSVTSQIYWANGANTIAYNWQIDENNYAAMWGYGGTAWAKLLTITSGGGVGIGTSTISQKLNISGNIMVAPASSSWAEGLSFTMPTASTWGGLRWRREVANNDGNHYVGYTGLDSTDDLVFGSNNAGTQINNNIRITKAGLVGIGTAPSQKFHVSGIGYSDTDFRAPIFYDSNNTSYYVDPASTSVFNALTVGGNNVLTTASTLTAGNLSGTIPSAVLGNSTLYVGTTAIVLNRGSASQTLTGISIDGNAATASNATQFGGEANTNFMRGLAGGTEANINNYTDNGFRTVAYTGHGKGLLSFNVGSSIGTVQHEYFYNIPTNGWRVRNKTDNTTWSSWGNIVMTDTNQGALTGTVITTGNSSGLSPTFSNLYAAVFYDAADSTYYLDPANTTTSLKTRSSIIINNASAPQNLAMLNIGYNGAGETRAIDIYGSWSGGENKSITFNHASTTSDIVAQINAQHNGPASRLRWGKLYHGGNSSTYTMELISESTTSAYLTVVGSVRAPIFYDSNDTTYYLDPAAATSLNIAGQITTAKTNGTLLSIAGADTIGYNATAGRGAYIKGTGGTYVYGSGVYYDGSSVRQMLYEDTWLNSKYFDSNGIIYSQTSMRAPIFYDYNDTGYYCDPASTSRLNILSVGTGAISITGAATATDRNLKIKGASSTGVGIVLYDSSDNFRCQLYGEPSNYGFLNGLWNAWDIKKTIGGNLFLNDNTTYYLNPASTTNLNTVNSVSLNGNYIGVSNTTNTNGYGLSLYNGAQSGEPTYGIMFQGTATFGTHGSVTSDWATYFTMNNSDARGWIFRKVGSGNVASVSGGGIITASGDIRAPIFYDSDNTGYYLNPAGSSQLSAVYANDWFRAQGNTGLYFQDKGYGITSAGAASNSYGNASTYGSGLNGWQGWGIGSRHCMMSTGGDNFGIHDNTRSWLYYWDGTYHRFQYGYLESANSVRGPLFYDSDNTSYYCDPASTSILNIVNNRENTPGGSGNTYYWSGSAMSFYWTKIANVSGGNTHAAILITYKTDVNYNPFGLALLSVSAFNSQTFSVKLEKLNGDSMQILVRVDNNNDVWLLTAAEWSSYKTWKVISKLGSPTVYYSSLTEQLTTPANSIEIASGQEVRGTQGAATSATVSTVSNHLFGGLTVRSDVRAPIFYDSNDTTYYTDPASTSNILELKTNKNWYDSSASAWGGGINMGGNNPTIGFQSTSSTWWYMLHHASSNINFYRRSTSGSWNHDGVWDSSGNFIWQGSSVRGQIFYDYNDTTYYLDAAGTSLLNTIRLAGSLKNNGDVSDDDGFGIYWESGGSTAYAIYREAGSWTYPYPDLRIAFHTGIKLGANAGYNGIRFYNDYDMATQVMSVNNSGDGLGSNNVYVNNSLQAGSSLRAPIFYDSDNTGYYIDPNGASSINTITSAQYYTTGWFRNNSSGNGLYNESTGQHFYSDSANYWNVASSANAQGIRLRTGGHNGTVRGYFYADTNNDVGFLNQDGSWRLRVVGGDYALADGSSMRAQIFYDSNDTSYYVDAASTSILNRVNYQQLRRNFGASVYSGPPSGSNIVKTFSGVLVAGSANGSTNTYTVIETSIPQGNYQMGGFTIKWFENYSSTNAKTTIEIAGYWNPTSNGGFIGFEFTSSNPNVQPTIQVGANASGNTVFILTHYSSSYPVIVARDLWFGYNSSDAEYGTGWTMTNTNSLAAYSNIVSATLRVGPTLTGTGASGTWGISITGSSASCTGNSATATTASSCSGNSATATTATNAGCVTSDTGNVGDSRLQYWQTSGNTTLNPDTEWYNAIRMGHGNPVTYYSNTLAVKMTGSNLGDIYTRTTTNGTAGTWNRFWNNNNDGAGSGLDADLLDGINSASFLRSDVSATNSVDLRSPIFYDSNNTAYYVDPASQSKLYNLLIDTGGVNTSMTIVGSNQPSIFLKTTDDQRNIEIFNSYGNFGIYRVNSPSNYIIYHVDNGASSSTVMQLEGTARLTINSNGLTGATSVRSPIFYDSDNTGYYIDAASTSILNLVRTRNTFGERIAVTSAASTTVDTNFNLTELTMSASITTLTLSNIQASTIVHMWTIVTVGNGTAYSITWPAAIKWPGGTAPTITSTNAKRDIYQFVTYDGGTNIYAIIVGQNL